MIRSYLAIFLLILVFCVATNAQEQQTNEQRIKELEVLVSQSKAQEAWNYASQLKQDLISQGDTTSELYANILQRQIWAKRFLEEYDMAMELVGALESLAKQKGYFVYLVHVYEERAHILRNNNQADEGLLYLRKAEKIIHKHNLDSDIPLRLSIKLSIAMHFHRVAEVDSAMYYAEEILELSKTMGKSFARGYSSQMIGIILQSNKRLPNRAIPYYQIAEENFLAVNDMTLVAMNHCHIAHNFYDLGRYTEALSNINRCIEMGEKYGNFSDRIWIWAYERKSLILRAMNKHDLAWEYINKVRKYEKNADQSNLEKQVREIEAKYQDEQKELLIEQQKQQLKEEELLVELKEKQLREEAQQRTLLIIIISIITFLVGIITLFYFRLRNAKQKVEAQASLISDQNKDLSISLEQQKLLLGEVHHRVKNNLQIIISLLELQFEDFEEEEKFKQSIDAVSNRIYSIAAIHEMMYQQDGFDTIKLDDYIQTLCTHISISSEDRQAAQFDFDLPDKVFNLETLTPLGIMLNELLTNSIKYAKQPNQVLEIQIKLSVENGGYLLYYKDNGKGLPEGKLQYKDGSLGSYLLTNMSRQLQGNMKCYNDNGAVFEIFFKEKNRN